MLLDTNVLLLFLFATFQPEMIGRKKLEKYTAEDGKLLVRFVGCFAKILTTAHVLAETSNLARQIVKDRRRLELAGKLHPLFCLDVPGAFEQRAVDGGQIGSDLFGRLGLTDSGLASLARSDLLLLTDDLDLYLAAVTGGRDAINFTHMREVAGVL